MAARLFSIATLVFFIFTGVANADIEALTTDGKRVLLKEDMTWRYLDKAAVEEDEYVSLTVVGKKALPNGCKLGIRLENHLTVDIKTLVPQFSAYIGKNIRFQTVFKEFSRIRPTLTQYREIIFTKIQCQEIQYIKVHGGDRCNMGELNRFTPGKGMCLKKVRVLPSDIFRMIKEIPVEESPPEGETPEDETPAAREPESEAEIEFKIEDFNE